MERPTLKTPPDFCLTKTPPRQKKASSGVLVYVVEELGDARLRCAQLKKYVKDALDLIEKSEHKDHFFEVAGNLLYGIPDVLMRLDKALDASALGIARLDYEEIKNGLRPEKADELESALNDTRLRYLNRRSMNASRKDSASMNAKSVAYFLNKLATLTEKQGHVPVAAVMTLVGQLEHGSKKAAILNSKAAGAFRNMAEAIVAQKNPSRVEIASVLRRIVGDTLPVGIEQAPQQGQGPQGQEQQAVQQQAPQQGQGQPQQQQAGAGEQFQKVNPGISDEEVKTIDEMHERHKSVVKDQNK